MSLSTALGSARFIEVFFFTNARCYGVNVYVDSVCANSHTFVPACMMRQNRLALVTVAGGLCANVMQISVLIQWLIQIRLNTIGAHGKLSRTAALYQFVRGLSLSAMLREFICTVPYFLIPPGFVGETGEDVFVMRTIACSLIVFLIKAVSLAEPVYGSEKVLDCWLGFFQLPLRLFERIHLCGTQIASRFYDAREDEIPPNNTVE